jgi:hypothetical protein
MSWKFARTMELEPNPGTVNFTYRGKKILSMFPIDVFKALNDTPLAISLNPIKDVIKSPYVFSANTF